MSNTGAANTGDTGAGEASTTTQEYIAEYTDGPLAGTAERRVLVEHSVEKVIDAYVAIEGIDTLLKYHLENSREVSGVVHARYLFDRTKSDPTVEDRDDGSGIISEVV